MIWVLAGFVQCSKKALIIIFWIGQLAVSEKCQECVQLLRVLERNLKLQRSRVKGIMPEVSNYMNSIEYFVRFSYIFQDRDVAKIPFYINFKQASNLLYNNRLRISDCRTAGQDCWQVIIIYLPTEFQDSFLPNKCSVWT